MNPVYENPWHRILQSLEGRHMSSIRVLYTYRRTTPWFRERQQTQQKRIASRQAKRKTGTETTPPSRFLTPSTSESRRPPHSFVPALSECRFHAAGIKRRKPGFFQRSKEIVRTLRADG